MFFGVVLITFLGVHLKNKGLFRCFFHVLSEDAGIEPKTVATLSLAVKRSNHSAIIDLIHKYRLDLIQEE